MGLAPADLYFCAYNKHYASTCYPPPLFYDEGATAWPQSCGQPWYRVRGFGIVR
jgi:hypothetical protein